MSILLQLVGIAVVLIFMIVCLLESVFYLKRLPFIKSTGDIRTLSGSMPIIGHSWMLWGKLENNLDQILQILEASGKNNMKFWFADKVFFAIAKPEDHALTLGSPNFLKKAPLYSIFVKNSIGERGIFFAEDIQEWKNNRKLITPTFHLQILKTFIKSFYIQSNILAENVRRKISEDDEVEVSQLLGLCTFDMIMETAMGITLHAQSNSSHVFIQSITTVFHTWFTRCSKPWLLNSTIFSLTSLKVKHDKAVRDIHSFAMGVLLDRLENRHTKSTTAGTKPGTTDGSVNLEDDDALCRSRNTKSILDLLIDGSYDVGDAARIADLIARLRQQITAQREQQGFFAALRQRFSKNNQTKEKMDSELNSNNSKNCAKKNEENAELERITYQLRDDIETIIVGGQETTGFESSFLLVMLALYQDVQAKVVAELEDIFGEDSRPPTFDDLQKMTYLECVIKETMRLFPMLPVTARVAEESTVLSDNSVLPKGSITMHFIIAIHRDPRYFPDPKRFLPERFLPENSIGRHPYSFLPFGAGTRNCIAQKYAMLQMKTVASTMLREFKILPSKRIPNLESLKVFIASTLRCQTGCWIRLQERNRLDIEQTIQEIIL